LIKVNWEYKKCVEFYFGKQKVKKKKKWKISMRFIFLHCRRNVQVKTRLNPDIKEPWEWFIFLHCQ
jgi:hypothetical protein